jgi:hypothetical protein
MKPFWGKYLFRAGQGNQVIERTSATVLLRQVQLEAGIAVRRHKPDQLPLIFLQSQRTCLTASPGPRQCGER